MDTLNERIKSLRKRKNLTQLQFAELLNITDKAVSKWEVGEANPDISLLPKIADIFNVSLDYLLTGKKEEDNISLEDMDCEKRIHYLIKKDDIENFIKYDYDKPSNEHKINIYRDVFNRYGNSQLRSLNIPIWHEIIKENACKIFNRCCDSLIEQTKYKISIAVLMTGILDDVIRKCIELDRADFLELLGVKYFRISDIKNANNTQKNTFYLPIVYERSYVKEATFFMLPKTLEYFFECADKSPKSFEYIAKIEVKAKLNIQQQRTFGRNEEYYTNTNLYSNIIELAIKYNKYDIIRNYLEIFKSEVKLFNQIKYREWYSYEDTFLFTNNRIVARLFDFSSDIINKLIKIGKLDLGKEIIEHNKTIVDILNRISCKNKNNSIYVISELDVERLYKLSKDDLSEEEKLKLEAVKNYLIDPIVLKKSRNLKLIREILDNNYYNYYEFAYESLRNKNVKDLFKFFVDNNFELWAGKLMRGEAYYSEILEQIWNIFTSGPGYSFYEENKRLIDAQNKIGIERGSKTNNDFYKFQQYAGNLGDNPIINRIKELKDEIYNDVVDLISSEKKAKDDEIAKEKLAKGLTKEYFEELLKKGQIKLFIIELCALQDAIFVYDYHYDGEDYSERLESHFKDLLDNKWECDGEILTKEYIEHLRNLFYRLRILRNNISHPKKEEIEELTISELTECLNCVFAIMVEE